MAVVALPWFVLETTGSPQRMSIVLAAEAAPLALLALVSGRVATRLGARRTMRPRLRDPGGAHFGAQAALGGAVLAAIGGRRR